MKAILRINRYVPETNSVSVTFCNLHSQKPIGDYPSKLVNIDNLDTTDVEIFIDGLMKQSGARRLENQDRKLPILDDNKPVEVRGELDFENIIMLGVNEGILPKGKIINSLIPYELKRFFKIPSYLERDAIFSYHFYRILQRAKNITLTYNSSLDDFGVGEKSRFKLSYYQSTRQVK